MHLLPVERLYFGLIPEEEDLGPNEKSFINVSWGCVDPKTNQNISEEFHVAVFATGRLGGLRGGLMHLSDLRSTLSQEDITGLAVEATQSQLKEKRTSVTNPHCTD